MDAHARTSPKIAMARRALPRRIWTLSKSAAADRRSSKRRPYSSEASTSYQCSKRNAIVLADVCAESFRANFIDVSLKVATVGVGLS